MAELVPDRATHQELKTLAQNIMTTQEAEIMQFMDWAMRWYNLDLMSSIPVGTAPAGMPRTGGADGTGLMLRALALLAATAAISGGVRLRRRV